MLLIISKEQDYNKWDYVWQRNKSAELTLVILTINTKLFLLVLLALNSRVICFILFHDPVLYQIMHIWVVRLF